MEYYHYDVISAYYVKAEIHNRYIAHPSVKKLMCLLCHHTYLILMNLMWRLKLSKKETKLLKDSRLLIIDPVNDMTYVMASRRNIGTCT